ncbi:MAG TPA: threonine/serine dehydratase [Acidobacteriota bacterium]|nr:threonine/serine dehydratase [Acidobacteriota bacterium]
MAKRKTLINIKVEAREAEERIKEYIRETPLEYSPYLSRMGKCSVFLKMENMQVSGSFKFRGAANKILSLDKKSLKKGVVTASSGNHGAAFSYMTRKIGIKGIVFLPENASQAKIDLLRAQGIDLRLHGKDCVETEAFAREMARKDGKVYIPPYNDLKTIGGQATVGIEIKRQLEKIDAVLVLVGGGSLISGIGGYLKSIEKGVKIIGCQPLNSPVMYESIKAGNIIEMKSKPTLSDGTVGGIEKGSITFDLCRKYTDDFILVSEDEIKEAINFCISKHHTLVEGAGALSIAAFIKEKEIFFKKNVVLIISGSKISMETLKQILC